VAIVFDAPQLIQQRYQTGTCTQKKKKKKSEPCHNTFEQEKRHTLFLVGQPLPQDETALKRMALSYALYPHCLRHWHLQTWLPNLLQDFKLISHRLGDEQKINLSNWNYQ
jgi:hypothetical protein